MTNEELREKVHRYLIKDTDFLKVKDNLTEDQLRNFVDSAVQDLCREQNFIVTFEQRTAIIRDLVSAVLSLGPLRILMEDPTITEVMVNGANQIFIQRNGKIMLTDVKFDNNRQLLHTIQKILAASGTNKRVDESSPYVDFSLPDGSRVNVILPPCSMIGPVVTIRKFIKEISTAEDLIRLKMLDQNISTLLIAAMKAKLNVIFCGSTGAGKTTALNVFSKYIPAEERIITIEDTPELRLSQEHVVSLTTKQANIEGKGEIASRELFVNSLRMRPDRIIIGEVRGGEMLDLIQSITSGHSGSLAIVHAESPEDCFNRMVTMMLMTGIQLSTEEVRRQIAKAIDLIVHVELFIDGRRRVTAISDIFYDDAHTAVNIKNIFAFEQKGISANGEVAGTWIAQKGKPSFFKKFEKRMIKLPEGFFTD